MVFRAPVTKTPAEMVVPVFHCSIASFANVHQAMMESPANTVRNFNIYLNDISRLLLMLTPWKSTRTKSNFYRQNKWMTKLIRR